MRRAAGLLIATALGACKPEVAYRAFLAPLDGQTGVPEDLDLVATTGPVELPPDYVTAPVVRVADLTEGGDVAGEVTFTDDAVRFTPDEPWLADHRYAWTLDPPSQVPHGPEMGFPEDLAGTTAFGTGDDVAVLAAMLVDESGLCVVLSRPLAENEWAPVRVTADDVELEKLAFQAVPIEEWGDTYELDSADPGVDAGCASLTTELATGSAVRFWWGGHGPFRFVLDEGALEDAVIALRRGSPS